MKKKRWIQLSKKMGILPAIVAIFCYLLTILPASATCTNDYHFVLIGMVVSSETYLPLQDKTISVINLKSNECVRLHSSEDGIFNLFLEDDTRYSIALLDDDNNTVATKLISTEDIKSSEIFQLLFEW